MKEEQFNCRARVFLAELNAVVPDEDVLIPALEECAPHTVALFEQARRNIEDIEVLTREHGREFVAERLRELDEESLITNSTAVMLAQTKYATLLRHDDREIQDLLNESIMQLIFILEHVEQSAPILRSAETARNIRRMRDRWPPSLTI